MKSDEPEAIRNAEMGGMLTARLPIEAYAPIEAPLAMPTQQLDVATTWLRWPSIGELIGRSKRNRKARAGAG